MTNVYGGDEVGAVVLDVGSYSCKVGYAGEDAPRSEIPSLIGVHDDPKRFAAEIERFETCPEAERTTARPTSSRYHYINPTELVAPKSGQEIKTFLREGIIDDWDLFDQMITYIYAKHVRSKTDQHPLMFSEPAWNTKIARHKLAELMFEKHHVPAMYPAINAMLVAFSTGRPTGVVFDSGANQTSAVAVLEGHVLKRSVVRTALGGESINGRCFYNLREKCGQFEINPIYRVKSKTRVEPGRPAEWIARSLPDRITDSYKKSMIIDVLRDYKHSVIKICPDGKYDSDDYAKASPVEYHFPDGYNLLLSPDEQYQLMEPFFDPDFNSANDSNVTAAHSVNAASANGISNSQTATPTTPMVANRNANFVPKTYPQIVLECVGKCDADIRASLLSSIILAGGNTLLPGFTDRMTNELYSIAPKNLRVKIAPNNSPIERKYAAWIGGSILASLGTFQQLWVSKLEYDEKGNSCLDLDSR